MKLRTNKSSPDTASSESPCSCYCLTLIIPHMKFDECLLPLPSKGSEGHKLMLYEMALSMTLLCLFSVNFLASKSKTWMCLLGFVKILVAKLQLS